MIIIFEASYSTSLYGFALVNTIFLLLATFAPNLIVKSKFRDYLFPLINSTLNPDSNPLLLNQGIS